MDIFDDQYFEWLYGLVANPKSRKSTKTYWHLTRQLFTTEFVWSVANDDSRAEDGRVLRYGFLDAMDIDEVDPDWMDVGCSFLEFLIGLSNRLDFQTGTDAHIWFWHLIETMGLKHCHDAAGDIDDEVRQAVDRVMYRTYQPDGTGGLFPLQHPTRDQRDVELWYQLHAYLLENF